ncbi:MAG: TMEM165/GDT1 family protein [Cyanophyceae cyanobacterium]
MPQPLLDPPMSVGESTQAYKDSVPSQGSRISRNNADQRLAFKGSNPFLNVFGTTFIAIFAAEFGDKTQLAVLLMTAESQRPWIVFLGAAIALVVTSLVGVLLGRFLARRVSNDLLEKVVGSIFLVVATSLLWDILHAA